MPAHRRKACRTCGVSYRVGGFYRHPRGADGLMDVCKLCHREAVNLNRELKAEYYREYQQRRMADPVKRAAKYAAAKAYAATPAGKAAKARAQRAYRLTKAERKSRYGAATPRTQACSPRSCAATASQSSAIA